MSLAAEALRARRSLDGVIYTYAYYSSWLGMLQRSPGLPRQGPLAETQVCRKS